MTTVDQARPTMATALAAGIALVWCTVVGTYVLIDPMLALEGAAVGLISVWALTLASDLRRAVRLGRRLDRMSETLTIDGVTVRIIANGTVEAFVLGVVRPRVYLGDASVVALDGDELRAVLHHEDHHRRTLAPLRAAAVEAWRRILGRSPLAHRLLTARLGQLEAAADAHAIRRGVHPGSIARALVKIDPHRAPGLAFAGAADLRVRALVDAAAGRPARRTTPLPYEWLPLVVAVAVTVACHLDGVATLL